jgi:hypothetical protein
LRRQGKVGPPVRGERCLSSKIRVSSFGIHRINVEVYTTTHCLLTRINSGLIIRPCS